MLKTPCWDIRVGVEIVRMLPRPIDGLRAPVCQRVPITGQQFDLPTGRIVASTRQLRFPQVGTSHGQDVDGLRLASGAR